MGIGNDTRIVCDYLVTLDVGEFKTYESVARATKMRCDNNLKSRILRAADVVGMEVVKMHGKGIRVAGVRGTPREVYVDAETETGEHGSFVDESYVLGKFLESRIPGSYVAYPEIEHLTGVKMDTMGKVRLLGASKAVMVGIQKVHGRGILIEKNNVTHSFTPEYECACDARCEVDLVGTNPTSLYFHNDKFVDEAYVSPTFRDRRMNGPVQSDIVQDAVLSDESDANNANCIDLCEFLKSVSPDKKNAYLKIELDTGLCWSLTSGPLELRLLGHATQYN